MYCKICNTCLKNKTIFMFNDNSYCSENHRNIDMGEQNIILKILLFINFNCYNLKLFFII